MPSFPRVTGPVEPVAVNEPFEVVIELGQAVEDPFRRVRVKGTLAGRITDGFCDSVDGNVFRWRALGAEPGVHEWHVQLEGEGIPPVEGKGTVRAEDHGLRGTLRPDGWGWRWRGTDEPYFWLGTTTYMIAGLSDERMFAEVDRMAGHGINHIRAAMCASRQIDGARWVEPAVKPNAEFSFHFGPWPARQPDSQENPEFDVTRFDIAFWQKFERLVLRARAHGMVVQAIFYMDAWEPRNFPFGDRNDGHDPDERRYYAYAAARLGAFTNIEYCICNEWAGFRSDESVEVLGQYLASQDAYGHPISVHGHPHFPFRASSWCTHALFQVWDQEGGYEWMLQKRAEQEAAGRVIPQVNEEYGYEDHYPLPWGSGRVAPARSPDSRRRIAWEIAMAGGWQTTGESAGETGGWINGWGESDNLAGYGEMRRFFESFDFMSFSPTKRFSHPWLSLGAEDGRTVLYMPQSAPTPPGFTVLHRVELSGGDAAMLLLESSWI
jgi:hypothetical protein